ncbi:uncharacterized protein VNE69_09146 [Vairimorpha necatrix]|uniref:Uncharacterized protein n=1 Tax=Vairimorpha necatrix TaxID=6039 RepID=A0AAX4JF24_9MICR
MNVLFSLGLWIATIELTKERPPGSKRKFSDITEDSTEEREKKIKRRSLSLEELDFTSVYTVTVNSPVGEFTVFRQKLKFARFSPKKYKKKFIGIKKKIKDLKSFIIILIKIYWL